MSWIKKLSKRFSETRLLREVAVTYSGQIIGSGIGFVIQILLQKALGPADYGILSLATSVGTLAAVFTDAGISHAMVRFGSKYLTEAPDKAMPRFTAALILRALLTVVVVAVGFFTASWIAADVFGKPELLRPLRWVYLGMAGGMLYGYWMFFIQTLQKFELRSVITVATALIRFGAFAAVWSLSLLSPTSMIIVDAGVNLTGFLIGMAFSPRGLFQRRSEDIKESFKEIIPYCRFTGVLIIGDTIFNELDTFMLGIFASEEVIGLYRAAWTYAMVLGFLNMSVANVLFPKVTSVSEASELRAYMRRILKFTAGLAILTLPAIPFLAWWIPWYEVRFSGATTIFYIMYVGLVADLLIGPLGYILYSLERPGILAGTGVLKIVLNVAGNLLLIPRFGAHGAAMATVITRLLGGLFVVYIIMVTLRRAEMKEQN